MVLSRKHHSAISMTQFVAELRFRGFDNQILVITSKNNYEPTKADFCKFVGVQVITETNLEEAKEFGLKNDFELATSKSSEEKQTEEIVGNISPQLPVDAKKGIFVCYNISCKDLAKNLNELSNLYVTFDCKEKFTQTYVISENLNPVFTRGCYRLIDISSNDKVRVTVWNKVPTGRDFEGQIELDMRDLISSIDEKHPTIIYTRYLKKQTEHQIDIGTITLEVTFFIES